MINKNFIQSTDLHPAELIRITSRAGAADVRRALRAEQPEPSDFATLISPAAGEFLEDMAALAQAATRRHFGRTISLYIPLYISNYCSGGCAYCGFAADRRQLRRRLNPDEIRAELQSLRKMGFDEILLLTGERDPRADFNYLRQAVVMTAEYFHMVAIEAFAMSSSEYHELALAGCQSVTLYQETYDQDIYQRMHRWGPKRDYQVRLNAPEQALAGGIRTLGMGVLLGLAEPQADVISLFLHVYELQKRFWRAGFSVSFPRLRPEAGGFAPPFAVTDRYLAQLIYAFRICLPDVPLVLSTREAATFRDGMAGVGINKMSIASRTTVGGYRPLDCDDGSAQFKISDQRTIAEFGAVLKAKGLEPVFKNWDRTFNMPQIS